MQTNRKMKKTKITPELRQTLIAALMEGTIGLKECGCVLQSIEDIPASEEEKECWNEYIALNEEMRKVIREGLHEGFIDFDRLLG